jgi:hypothetical protein
MAALNLTIDKAPTKPSDKAREDFTTVIIIVVDIQKGINKFEKSSLFDSDEAVALYTSETRYDNISDKIKLNTKVSKLILILIFEIFSEIIDFMSSLFIIFKIINLR